MPACIRGEKTCCLERERLINSCCFKAVLCRTTEFFLHIHCGCLCYSRSLCSCKTSPLNCGLVSPCGFTMNLLCKHQLFSSQTRKLLVLIFLSLKFSSHWLLMITKHERTNHYAELSDFTAFLFHPSNFRSS